MSPGSILRNAFFAALMAGLLALMLYGHNLAARPYTRALMPSGTQDPHYENIPERLQAPTLRRHLEALRDAGNRFPGLPGCDRAADYIAETLRELGYDVVEQPFTVTVPVTKQARLLDASGRPLQGADGQPLELYPMLPNWFRTCTTPPEGLQGRVFRGEMGLAREFEGRPVNGNIVLLPLGRPWAKVAGMGATAVLYHEERDELTGEPRLVRAGWTHSVEASLNIPRFLVRGDISNLEGARITLDCRVDWEERVVRNILAFREPPEASEAILLNAYYDAFSYVPDLTQGGSQACGAAALLAAAEQLAAEPAEEQRRCTALVFNAGHAMGNAGLREIIASLGVQGTEKKALQTVRDEVAELETHLRHLEAAQRVLADDAYWSAAGAEAEEAYWNALQADDPEMVRREAVDTILRVLDHDFMRHLEAMEQARVDWVRAGMPVTEEGGTDFAPTYNAYEEKREVQDYSKMIISIPLADLKAREGDVAHWETLREREVPARSAEEIEVRLAQTRRRLAAARGRRTVAERFAPYRGGIFGLTVELTGATGRMGLLTGAPNLRANCVPADAELEAQFRRASEALDRLGGEIPYTRTPLNEPRIQNLVRKRDALDLAFKPGQWLHGYFGSTALLHTGRPAFTLVTTGDDRARMGTPADTFAEVLKTKEAIRAEMLAARAAAAAAAEEAEEPAEEAEPPAGPEEEADAGAGAEDTAAEAAAEDAAGDAAGEAEEEPLVVPEPPLHHLTVSSRLLTAAASQMVRGQSRIVPVTHEGELFRLHGRVVSQVGDSLTPNHPMPGAVVRAAIEDAQFQLPGVGRDHCLLADWAGHFEMRGVWRELLTTNKYGRYPVELDAAVSDAGSGDTIWVRSQKSAAAGDFNSEKMPISNFQKTQANVVVFRASSVMVFPMADPSTMKPYDEVNFIETKGLAQPEDFKQEKGAGSRLCYAPPASKLYFTFLKAKKTNQAVKEIRAFALNASGPADGSEVEAEGEIFGPGYLAADTPRIVNVELDTALSMAQVNARRVAMQMQYGMTDRMTEDYNRNAVRMADRAQELATAGETVRAKATASNAIAYGGLIHPVIRGNASDAIWGILFYLFLAIPFTVFMEKLLIGHPDIRYQLGYQGVFFLLFFFALWAVHPAFELVRSAYMILLGFITCALAIFVGGFVSARFSNNVSDLHRRSLKEVETADVSRAGAAATAFLLGLNNLRKRAVRTGLTVATLILITFVMICFTTVSTNVVDTASPVGAAPYTGFLHRHRSFKDQANSLPVLREKYGKNHYVAPRAWGGNFEVEQNKAPELRDYLVSRQITEKRVRESTVHGILGLSTFEPQVMPIESVMEPQAYHGWFEDDADSVCYLPRPVADALELDDEEIRRGTATVMLSGAEYRVFGVFDPVKMDLLLDLDGESMLPVNIVAMRDPPMKNTQQREEEEETEIPEDQPRLEASVVAITPFEQVPGKRDKIASIAVALAADRETAAPLEYAAANELITQHLERTGEMTYYGLDEVAFWGGKFRAGSMKGFLDLLLPIILSALTVLNTMRGSVYERKNELYVFNAVGLAPNHIRFLFLAEACVYAVVGAVGGYLLAQGVGTTLEGLNPQWLGLATDATSFKSYLGVTMNYSSLSVVLVTVVIMVVVFASSIFPARMASQLAAPAETMTRERQGAEGDVLELDLPFTFNQRDRVAIIPYFMDWFDNYGEGSAGEFFCSPPEPAIRKAADGHLAPAVSTITWLKPYDLGVSQHVEVVVRYDPETGDNLATVVMTRRSGDKESWERCCHAFIGFLRKRFLTWRAVSDEDRAHLLARGQELLDPQTDGDSA